MNGRDEGLGPTKTWSGPDPDADYGLGDLLLMEEKVKTIFADFIVYEEDKPDEARIMEFDHTITEEEARTGVLPQGVKTNMRIPGTRLRHWISALSFAKVFYEVLSDQTIPYDKEARGKRRDGDLISYIIMYDRLFNLGHGRFIGHWREEGKI